MHDPGTHSSCPSCGVLLAGGHRGLCVNCSSQGGVETGLAGSEVKRNLGRATHVDASSGKARCLRCGATLTGGASSNGWCDQCLSSIAEEAFAPLPPKPEPTPPVEIPGYRMMRYLGGGGMGVVWLAEQGATKQTVAIKFCREDRFAIDPDSRALQRFEREVELAARLSHPHIARVFGGGEVEGVPYCVMEYVEGLNLAEHVRTHPLDRKAVVALMARVAEAVQHAHQNGIIHRDLKPSNILVSAKGQPKVLDFGLAKALEGTEGASQELSQSGQIIGTPRYMAPEQVRGEAVDTRTDVYALGVILCELLTGQHPHDSSGAREALLHRIATDEPRRPRTLRSDLDSELEMLLLKSLSKSPDERYRTAGEFADDLARWLRDEPLAAGRATPAYFARKWLRRHRTEAIAAAVLLGVSVWAVSFYVKNVRLARDKAQKRLVQIEKANEIWTSVFARLDPKAEELGDEPLGVQLGEGLDRVASQIEGEAIGDPLVVAKMQRRVGESLINLSYPDRAVLLFTKARQTLQDNLGPDHPDTLTSMNHLALAYRDAGKLDQAVPLLRETLQLSKASLGPDHRDTLTRMNDLAAACWDAGKVDEALRLFEETLTLSKTRLGADDRLTIECMNNLAATYYAAGKLDQALVLFQETLEIKKAQLGPDNPGTLETMSNLAVTYQAAGKLDQALPLSEETLKLRTAKLGANHRLTLESMDNLAVVCGMAGQLDRSLSLAKEALDLKKVRLGPDHQKTLTSMNNLAMAYRDAGRLDEAFPLAEETLERMKAKLKADHPTTLIIMNNLGVAYLEADKVNQALPLFEEGLKLRKASLAPDDRLVLESLDNLAGAWLAAGKLDRAVPLFEESFKLKEAKFGPEDPVTLTSMQRLAIAFQEADKSEQALPLLDAVLRQHKAKGGRALSRELAASYVTFLKARGVARLPANAPLLADIAVLLSENNKLDQAAAVAQRTLELDPGNEIATGIMAKIKARQSDPKK